MSYAFYIYRNLPANCYSIKYRSRVIAHVRELTALNVEFRVNPKGRERVRREKKKYVHAYAIAPVVLEAYRMDLKQAYFDMGLEVLDHVQLRTEPLSPLPYHATYNPYIDESFKDVDTRHALLHSSKVVLTEDGITYS